MFQTEPILFLQSFASDGLTALMTAVTWFGYPPAYAAILSIILFAVSFRRGFVLLQMVLWTAILNDTAKELFALPRPHFVDSNVQILGQTGSNPTPFESKGAVGFWRSLDPTIVNSHHYESMPSWGLPSGHTAVFTALWGGLAVLFEPLVIRIMLLPMVIAMALSRMYLGRHFLADVVGGIVLGSAVVLLARPIVKYANSHQFQALDEPAPSSATASKVLSMALLIALPLLGMLFLRADGQRISGLLLGANCGFLALSSRDHSADPSGLWPRIFRVLLAWSLFFGAAWLVQSVGASNRILPLPWVQALRAMLPSFLLIWGSVVVGDTLDTVFRRWFSFD